jgi:hypothetical protein
MNHVKNNEAYTRFDDRAGVIWNRNLGIAFFYVGDKTLDTFSTKFHTANEYNAWVATKRANYTKSWAGR